MANEQLVSYIQGQLQAGADKDTILKTLQGAGWEEAQINEAMQAVESGPSAAATSSASQPDPSSSPDQPDSPSQSVGQLQKSQQPSTQPSGMGESKPSTDSQSLSEMSGPSASKMAGSGNASSSTDSNAQSRKPSGLSIGASSGPGASMSMSQGSSTLAGDNNAAKQNGPGIGSIGGNATAGTGPAVSGSGSPSSSSSASSSTSMSPTQMTGSVAPSGDKSGKAAFSPARLSSTRPGDAKNMAVSGMGAGGQKSSTAKMPGASNGKSQKLWLIISAALAVIFLGLSVFFYFNTSGKVSAIRSENQSLSNQLSALEGRVSQLESDNAALQAQAESLGSQNDLLITELSFVIDIPGLDSPRTVTFSGEVSGSATAGYTVTTEHGVEVVVDNSAQASDALGPLVGGSAEVAGSYEVGSNVLTVTAVDGVSIAEEEASEEESTPEEGAE